MRWFLTRDISSCATMILLIDTCSGVGVYQHNTVQYAGVVYFKNQEDAIKAVKILGKRVKSLFD